MERLKTYTGEQGIALADFSIAMRSLKLARSKAEIESATNQHRNVVERCLDLGLVAEICLMRDKWKETYG